MGGCAHLESEIFFLLHVCYVRADESSVTRRSSILHEIGMAGMYNKQDKPHEMRVSMDEMRRVRSRDVFFQAALVFPG